MRARFEAARSVLVGHEASDEDSWSRLERLLLRAVGKG